MREKRKGEAVSMTAKDFFYSFASSLTVLFFLCSFSLASFFSLLVLFSSAVAFAFLSIHIYRSGERDSGKKALSPTM